MISFSPLTKLMVAAALVSSSTAGIAQSAPKPGACQGANCVLPLQAPAAAPVEAAPAPVDTVPVETTSGKGLGLLPLLIGAALAAIALYFILDDEDDEEPVSA